MAAGTAKATSAHSFHLCRAGRGQARSVPGDPVLKHVRVAKPWPSAFHRALHDVARIERRRSCDGKLRIHRKVRILQEVREQQGTGLQGFYLALLPRREDERMQAKDLSRTARHAAARRDDAQRADSDGLASPIVGACRRVSRGISRQAKRMPTCEFVVGRSAGPENTFANTDRPYM